MLERSNIYLEYLVSWPEILVCISSVCVGAWPARWRAWSRTRHECAVEPCRWSARPTARASGRDRSRTEPRSSRDRELEWHVPPQPSGRPRLVCVHAATASSNGTFLLAGLVRTVCEARVIGVEPATPANEREARRVSSRPHVHHASAIANHNPFYDSRHGLKRLADGTSRHDIEPAFFQPARNSHV
jgi:hypothetical protein